MAGRAVLVWPGIAMLAILAGHYLFRVPWHRILADYNIVNGRIWTLVPIVTLVASVAAAYRGELS